MPTTWYTRYKLAEQFWGREGSGVLIICTEDKTVLLLLRSWSVEQPGTWGIPGGAVKREDESNEDFFDEESISASEHVHESVSLASAVAETKD